MEGLAVVDHHGELGGVAGRPLISWLISGRGGPEWPG